jgi:D-beta-D-heptose 7-phosphate kinase/D-beta-D-heptose 1-phosphate adenosyltransferase
VTGPLVVLGDCLLDVDIEGDACRLCPDAPVPVVDQRSEHHRPGGAGLAALLAAREGAGVVLITAMGDDPSGRLLEGLLSPSVEVVRLPMGGTTVRKTRIRARGQTLLRVDTGGRPRGPRAADGSVAGRAAAALRTAGAVLVSDYGGHVAEPYRDLLRDLAAPVVWDPHPRGGTPIAGCALVTPNESEASALSGKLHATPDQVARRLLRDLGAEAVAVTLGDRGAVLARRGGKSDRLPAPVIAAGGDTCGAGDRFAAAAALGLARGAPVEAAVAAAVHEAARFVEGGGASAVRLPAPAAAPLPGTLGDTASGVADAVRAAGGRLIATGGCFDLLHAGHVSLLRRARALGDALVVCVNSDDSVRRLKGPGRPVVGERDRVEILRALACVDAVTVFSEDTPATAIGRLRPDLWVKGGDYTGRAMPEAEAVEEAGGEIVILPSVPGYSTTGLIAAAQAIA